MEKMIDKLSVSCDEKMMILFVYCDEK